MTNPTKVEFVAAFFNYRRGRMEAVTEEGKVFRQGPLDKRLYHWGTLKQGVTPANWTATRTNMGDRFEATSPPYRWDFPSEEQFEEWAMDSVCEATDGCTTEPDGTCEHGHPSWLMAIGVI